MVTAHIDSEQITIAILMGQLGNTEIRIIGTTVGILLAIIILFLHFYVGNPEPRRPSTATDLGKLSELSTPDSADSAPEAAASGTRDGAEGLQNDDSDHGSSEADTEEFDGSEKQEQEWDPDELADAHFGKTTLTHETRGERSRGLLVEVTDGEHSEEFFVREWTSPDPSVSTAGPRSCNNNDWVAAGREYLRERAIRGDLTADETDPKRTHAGWVAGIVVAASIVGIGLVGLHYLLGLYPLAVKDEWGFSLRLTDAIVSGTSVFDALVADTLRYLVFAGGALAVLQESDHGPMPKQLAGSVFAVAVALPSGVLLVAGVDLGIALGGSMARAAVFPTVAVLGFQRAYRMITQESVDVSSENSHHPLVRRTTVAFLKGQWVYGRLTGESLFVSDKCVCCILVRRVLVMTGIGAALVGGVWFVETLQRTWEYLLNPVEIALFIVGEFVFIGAGVASTILVLTALVLATLWLSVRPIVATRVIFAVGVFSVASGVLNLLTMYVIPVPIEVVVGRVVKWSLIAPQPGWTLIWILDLLNVQEVVVLVGFAYGTQALRRTASG
jgi:hypothetical protein